MTAPTAPSELPPIRYGVRDLLITDGFVLQHLSVRTASALGNYFRPRGPRPTIGAVIDASDEDLLRVPNIGPVAVEEVHRLRAAVIGEVCLWCKQPGEPHAKPEDCVASLRASIAAQGARLVEYLAARDALHDRVNMCDFEDALRRYNTALAQLRKAVAS